MNLVDRVWSSFKVALAASTFVLVGSGPGFASNCHKECALPTFGGCGQWVNVCLPDSPNDIAGIPNQIQRAVDDIKRETGTACASASAKWIGTNGACAGAIAAAIGTTGTLWVAAGGACYQDYQAMEAFDQACGSHAKIQYPAGGGGGPKAVYVRNFTPWNLTSVLAWPEHETIQQGHIVTILRTTLMPFPSTNNIRRGTLDTKLGCRWHLTAGYHPNNNTNAHAVFVESNVDICRSTWLDVSPTRITGQ